MPWSSAGHGSSAPLAKAARAISRCRSALHLFILPLLFGPVLFGLTPAAAQQVHTPSPGTSERTQILDALRPPAGSKIRFIVHRLQVVQGKTATYAYAVVDPSKQEYDGGEHLLRKSGQWRVIWSVTGGGTDNCSAAADYYLSALRLLAAEGIDPEKVSPQVGPVQAILRQRRRSWQPY